MTGTEALQSVQFVTVGGRRLAIVDAKPEAVAYYERFGLESIEALEGTTLQRPAPTPMFLSLGAVPQRRDE